MADEYVMNVKFLVRFVIFYECEGIYQKCAICQHMGNQIIIINSSEVSWDQTLSFGISQL